MFIPILKKILVATQVESMEPSLVTVKCMNKDRASGSIWCWLKRDDKIENYNMFNCERAEKPKHYGTLSDKNWRCRLCRSLVRQILCVSLTLI